MEPECYLYVNGEQIQEIPVINGYAEYLIDVPENPEDLYHIGLRTNCYFVPADVGINGDTRELSIQL